MGAAASSRFAENLVDHMKEIAPRHVDVIGEESLRGIVQGGIERAKTHGFTKRGPVRFFATLEKIAAPAFTMVPTPELPGIATFSVKGDSIRLAPGTRMMWKTARYSAGSP